MTMPDPIKQIRQNETQTGVFHIMLPWAGDGGYIETPLRPALPGYWSPARDVALRATIHAEAMWDTAVAIAMAQVASQSWEIDSNTPRKSQKAKDMLAALPWVPFIMKQLRDYLLTDNGCFFGLERESSSAASRVVNLYHLDSGRCLRTGDAKVPVLYRDRMGKYYELKAHQVAMLSDEPDPAELWNGIGHCAASRAYKAVYKLAGLETFLTEKVTGRRPLAIHLISGITNTQLNDAIETAKQQAAQKGAQVYMGALLVALLGDQPAAVNTVPLAEVPNGFEAEPERKNAQLTYANALGLDPQDINPDLLATRAMGTGAQAKVIDDKAKGKTIAVFRQQMTHALNEYIFPDTVTWYFVEKDLRDQKAKADIAKVRAETRKVMVESQQITPDQALQMAVDQDDAPKEFLPADETPDTSLGSEEKPDAEGEPGDEAGPVAPIVQGEQPEVEEPEEPEDDAEQIAKQWRLLERAVIAAEALSRG